MFKRVLISTVLLFGVAAAGAGISAGVVPVYGGFLSDGTTRIYSYDLRVTVDENDAWTCAGGAEIGVPWVTVTGGTFYQNAVNDSNPIYPALIEFVPDSQWSSFYTTHRGYPNTAEQGAPASFALGPVDTPTALTADWFCLPDGNCYPGTFTIARFTVIPTVDSGAGCYATVDVQIGASVSGGNVFHYHHEVLSVPEPGGLALLALSVFVVSRRR